MKYLQQDSRAEREIAKNQLRMCRMVGGESVSSFVLRFHHTVSKLAISLPEEDVLHSFVTGLLPTIMPAVKLGGPRNLTQAIDLAQAVEVPPDVISRSNVAVLQ